MLDLVLGKPCWLSTLNYSVCSICLSFLCIVYNTKLQLAFDRLIFGHLCIECAFSKSDSGSCVFCAPLDRYIGGIIDRHSTDASVDILAECRTDISVDTRPISRLRYVGRHIDRCINRDISVDIAADTRPIRQPLIVGGVSVDCPWYIGIKLRLSMTDV